MNKGKNVIEEIESVVTETRFSPSKLFSASQADYLLSGIPIKRWTDTALLNILKCRAKEMTEPDRLCILSFDECSIAP